MQLNLAGLPEKANRLDEKRIIERDSSRGWAGAEKRGSRRATPRWAPGELGSVTLAGEPQGPGRAQLLI